MSLAATLQLPIQATPLSQQAKPSPADREPPPKRPFAEMLQQSRAGAPVAQVASAMPVPVPQAESVPGDNGDGGGDTAAAAATTDTPPKSLPMRPRVRGDGGMTTCSVPTESESAAKVETTAADEHDDRTSDGRGLAVGHTATQPWRAIAVAAVEPGRVAATGNAAATGADADAALVDASSARPATAGVDARSRSGRVADSTAANQDPAGAASLPLAIAANAERSPGPASSGRHAGSDAVDGAATLAAATPAAASPLDAAASAPPLTVATPVDSPDFAAAFGLQVSLLAKDGVQQAELHLNPADLGPVSIHIALTGSEARIDFGADLAATRHAIEQGLPELASALRDAGFTLAGGGVSQHAGERPGSDDGSAGDRHRHRRLAPIAAVDAPSLARAARAAGAHGVDLYA